MDALTPFLCGACSPVSWLYEQAAYPAEGDDTWQPHVANHHYGTDFAAPVPARAGKNVGWTDWTHGIGTGAPELGWPS